jgi:hypothetical protein
MENTPNTIFSATVTFSGTPSWWHMWMTEMANLPTSNALDQHTHEAGTTDSGPGNTWVFDGSIYEPTGNDTVFIFATIASSTFIGGGHIDDQTYFYVSTQRGSSSATVDYSTYAETQYGIEIVTFNP